MRSHGGSFTTRETEVNETTQSIRPARSRGTSDAALAIKVNFTGESDHEMEIRVRDGAHGSARGRSSVGSVNARKGAHAGLAGEHAPEQSTRNLARLAAAALDASIRNSCPTPGTDGHAGQSSITDGPGPMAPCPPGTLSQPCIPGAGSSPMGKG